MTAAVMATALAACGGTSAKPTALPSDLRSPFTGYESAQYGSGDKWLCLPGRADTCKRDLTATEIRADGSRGVLPQAVATNAEVDCFYVYPTVDMRVFVAKNHDDFTDVSAIARVAVAQAALFGQVCSLYAPLYRQVTIGTYLRRESRREQGLAVAFSDVADAFLHYMSHYNRGRKIVLLGHSQGAEMVKRLIKRFFDEDPAMRERLLLAMPIGGDFDVPLGRMTGGTFHNVPPCTKDGEVGCVVAFRSHREDSDVPSPQVVPPGSRAICVNPGNVVEEGARAPLRAFFPTFDKLRGLEGVTTPYVFYRDLYTGRCIDGPKGTRTLEIAETGEPGGMRTSPIDLSTWMWGTRMGTHIADFQFAQGDLIEMVRARAKR
jgi:hypothetical protein